VWLLSEKHVLPQSVQKFAEENIIVGVGGASALVQDQRILELGCVVAGEMKFGEGAGLAGG